MRLGRTKQQRLRWHPIWRTRWTGLQQRIRINGKVSVAGILEAYNLFNHENYGTYEVRESNAAYGLPIPNPSLVYQPRMLQLGFRTTF